MTLDDSTNQIRRIIFSYAYESNSNPERRHDFLKELKALFEKGANINGSKESPHCPLSDAVRFDLPEVVQLLLDHNVNRHPKDLLTLMKSDSTNGVKIAKLLINYGFNPNIPNSVGNYPLHYLPLDDELLSLILVKQANIEVKDKWGHTPLMSAAIYGKTSKNVELLLKHGADIHARDLEGLTPLHHTVFILPDSSYTDDNRKKLVTECMELLLKNGADPNAKNNDGQTLLHLICMKGLSEPKLALSRIKCLLENGALPLVRDNKRRTPLQIAKAADPYSMYIYQFEKIIPVLKEAQKTIPRNPEIDSPRVTRKEVAHVAAIGTGLSLGCVTEIVLAILGVLFVLWIIGAN